MKQNVLRLMTVVFVSAFVAFTVLINATQAGVYAVSCEQAPNNPNCTNDTPTPTATVGASATPTDVASPTPTTEPTSTPHGVQKIRICHSTDSHSNPYTNPNVDQDAADGDTGNDNGQGDHYIEHQGPIWYQGIPDHSWGDIIPPVTGNPGHSGLNWNSNGQAIWNNNCNIPTATATPDPGTPAPTPEPTATPNNNNNSGGGSSSVGGTSTESTSTGRVLGATTLASSGAGEDLMSLVFSVGAISASLGIRYAKKEASN